ncbi:MAG: glycine--tRNA ligase [Candidatus Dojkabacteria bacterium]|nr:glycine--tRNA ligase [Candidatus Dojkabacteria bacterium]
MRNNSFEDLDTFKAWCKENGFVYPSSEIYGGFAAVYDYGPYGTLLKNNIQREWEKYMIQERNDIYLIDSAIFMHPKTWEASGHVQSFADVLVEDKKTHKRYRADHLIEEYFESMGEKIDCDKKTPEELANIIQKYNILSPDGNELTTPRNFGLMVKTNIGTTDSTLTDQNVVYARAETCQGIYLNYKNIIDTFHPKLPFGIAQVGKAFRNEIVARQFIFRTREFEQMEMQYFHHPKDKDRIFDMWMKERMNWLVNVIGLRSQNLRFKRHEKLVFYASKAFDIEYNFRTLGGFKELEGIHDRGDYDLSQHSKFSGIELDYFDPDTQESFIPHIIETSIGLNRLFFAVLEDALTVEKVRNGKGEIDNRIVLKISKYLSPIKIGILPLVKQDKLIELSRSIQNVLKREYITQIDISGSIGKRYRRFDEIGTPYCITVDFKTLEDSTVTVRDRDTMQQDRVSIADLTKYFSDKFK